MRSKACSRVIRLSNEDCISFLQQPPVEMDVSEDATVLDLNEYENDTTVIDLNDGTRRVNVYEKLNSRLGERYDLIPDSDASINDEGLIRLVLPRIRYIVGVKTYTVNGKQEVRNLNTHDMDSCCTRTFNFKMSVRWSDLSDGDRQTNRYAYHNIHPHTFQHERRAGTSRRSTRSMRSTYAPVGVRSRRRPDL